MKQNQIEIAEKKGLKFGIASNFIAGTSGVIVFFLIGAGAMLLDGAFSLIGFLSSVLAIVIAYKSGAKSNEKNPTGAYIYENLFLLFRTFFLISYLGITAMTAIIGIIKNEGAALSEPVALFGQKFKPEHFLIGYSIAMFTLHSLLLWNNWRLNRKVGFKSELLKVESRAALIDFLITLGAVAALIIAIVVPSNGNQIIQYFKDQADNYIVVIIAVVLLIEPLKQFKLELARLAGRRADRDTESEMFKSISKKLKHSVEDFIECAELELVDIYLVQRGKVSDIHLSISFTGKKEVKELDCIRENIEQRLHEIIEDSSIHIEWSSKKIHEIHR